MSPPPDTPGRYHVTLTAEGRRVLDGWWNDEITARRKVRSLVGEQGRDGVVVTLVDTVSGETLTTWPEPA
ncbi:hypothetical protein ACFZAO_05115 [Streptomyces griseoaurantiacus]|uniref:hypothetical protein n=1 Tax=Streptomyces griseoaurantiacus TaxID=68213 RepID=UPI0036ECA75A